MLVTYFVNFKWLNVHLFGKELFIRFTASAWLHQFLIIAYLFTYLSKAATKDIYADGEKTP